MRIEVITGDKNKEGVRVIKLTKLPSFNIPKRSSTSSNRQEPQNQAQNSDKSLDDPAQDKGETSSTTSSKENGQNQAQNNDFGRLDGLDDLYPNNETPDEKYLREQEEQKNRNEGLES